VSTLTAEGAWAVQFPMGTVGLILPVAIFAATLTSLRIGFGASGTLASRPADDWVGECILVADRMCADILV
jgi:hypothetical protein